MILTLTPTCRLLLGLLHSRDEDLMLKMTRTIWITCVTLIALMLASVANCAPLIPIQETSISATAEHTTVATVHFTSANYDKNQPPEEIGSIHHCCSAMCLLSFPVTESATKILLQPYSFALIRTEAAMATSAFARALYKPPIV